MSTPRAPNSAREATGSLWITRAAESATVTAFNRPLVDENVTAEKIREAVDATKERAAAFSGPVSDEALRTSVE